MSHVLRQWRSRVCRALLWVMTLLVLEGHHPYRYAAWLSRLLSILFDQASHKYIACGTRWKAFRWCTRVIYFLHHLLGHVRAGRYRNRYTFTQYMLRLFMLWMVCGSTAITRRPTRQKSLFSGGGGVGFWQDSLETIFLGCRF